jgi:hypothetical protein
MFIGVKTVFPGGIIFAKAMMATFALTTCT